jgi:hypothetical protein
MLETPILLLIGVLVVVGVIWWFSREVTGRIASWTVQREVGFAARNGCMGMADIERSIGVCTGYREIVVVTVEQIKRRRLSRDSLRMSVWTKDPD